jgi:ABC-type glycerol-3-phosphate transport system substrate-binding protein
MMLGTAVVAAVGLDRDAHAEHVDTIVQWQTNLRPADIKGINALVAEFEAQNPDLEVHIVPTPWDTHEQKILAAFTAGTGLPDVGRLADCGAAANIGYVKPLDQYVDKAWHDEIFEVAWKDVTFVKSGDSAPHIWAIPKMLATEVWFYNKTMFKNAGIDPEKPPQTTAEFADIAKKLTLDTDKDGRIDQWGVDLTCGDEGGPERQYISAAKAFGGRLVATPNYIDSKPGDAIAWNSPETVAAFNWLIGMYKDGSSPPSTISDTVRDVANNFRAGKVAMAMCGPWEMQATGDAFNRAGWDWGLFRFPQGPAGRADFMYVGALGLFSQTKKDAEVIRYLRYYTSAKGIVLYMKVNGMIPANKEALADPYYSQDPRYKVIIDTINNADLVTPKWMSLLGTSTLFDGKWTPIYQKMLAGDVTVERGVAQMDKLLRDFIKGA